jgi:hypothetical protein
MEKVKGRQRRVAATRIERGIGRETRGGERKKREE